MPSQEEIDWTWNWWMFLLGLFGVAIVLLLSLYAVYPVMISSNPINHSQVKSLIYSVPVEYYQYIDVIEVHPYSRDYLGYTSVRWTRQHDCYNGRVSLYNNTDFKVLQHELGHIYEMCVLKRDYNGNSEVFAEGFKIL